MARPALDLYEKYLGEHAAGLPASGLLSRSWSAASSIERGVVRTILAVDRDSRSLTFAGDVPVGYYARLSARTSTGSWTGRWERRGRRTSRSASEPAELALLVSCVGRKLVLKQRVEEEVEAVERVLGAGVPMCGFYSYGEIAPFAPDARCELHNQTMTVTTFTER